MTDNPITPPPELVRQWMDLPLSCTKILGIAARWGADQELKACCEWITKRTTIKAGANLLRADRRPKPPSLKEQALAELEHIPTHDNEGRTVGVDVSIIRRALEELPE